MNEVLETIDMMDKVTIVFSFITMFVVIGNFSFNRWKEYKNRQLIQFFFEVDGCKESNPRFSIIRKDVTRAEIAGYLSFIQKDSKDRYSIDYLMTQQFFDDIYNIQQGKVAELIIKMDKVQQEKFAWIKKD